MLTWPVVTAVNLSQKRAVWM